MATAFDYTSAFGQGGPFGGFAQGIQTGAQLAQMDERRALAAAQQQQALAAADAERQKVLAQQAAIEQKAAEAAELAQLQGVPLPDMTQAQRLRLMQLSGSEVTRGYISRSLEQMTSEQRAGTARTSGSVAIALARSPDIGKQRLQQLADAEVDPQRKKAYQDIAKVAEINPIEAARMIHSMMMMTGDESFTKVGDAVTNYLKNSGSPLYPEPKPLRIVGGAVFDEATREFMLPPRQSQLLTPQEEAQKARLAAAGRAPSQPREPAAPTITQIQDPSNPTQTITIDARRYQGGSVGAPGVIGVGGKTADAARKEVKAEEGKTLVSDIIDSLKTNYQELDKARAIPSAQRGALSNLLTAIEVSGPGQLVARAVGSDVQPLRDVVKSSRLQLLNAIKQATGLSSQQLNSNVELQTWLSSVSDPTQQIEAVIPILDNIEKFVGSGGKYSARRATGEVKPAGAAPAAAPTAPRRREIAPGVFVTER
jgi:hypothetical protein